ncbi:MAG: hypothetical protein P8Y45_14410, partial [Exilibacterium sp.]
MKMSGDSSFRENSQTNSRGKVLGKLGELSYVDADPVRKDEFFVAAAKLIAGSTLPEYWTWVDSSETARVAH